MTNAQIVSGNTVYLATCAHCGKQRMTFARNKAQAANQLRDAGWAISDNNLCESCRGKPVFEPNRGGFHSGPAPKVRLEQGEVILPMNQKTHDAFLRAAMKQRHDDMFL